MGNLYKVNSKNIAYALNQYNVQKHHTKKILRVMIDSYIKNKPVIKKWLSKDVVVTHSNFWSVVSDFGDRTQLNSKIEECFPIHYQKIGTWRFYHTTSIDYEIDSNFENYDKCEYMLLDKRSFDFIVRWAVYSNPFTLKNYNNIINVGEL